MKTIMKYLVLFIVMVMLGSVAFASSSSVIIDGDCLLFRDGSGNELCLQAGASITPGTVIYNAGGGETVTTTGTETLTNKTLTSPALTTPTITAGTDGQFYISNGTLVELKSVTGDIGFTNAGVGSLNANVVGASQAYINTVSLVIASGAASNSVAVWSGSSLIGTLPVSGLTNNVVLDQSTYYNGTWYIGSDSNAGSGTPIVVNGVFFNPN